jgi:hypothetical protein
MTRVLAEGAREEAGEAEVETEDGAVGVWRAVAADGLDEEAEAPHRRHVERQRRGREGQRHEQLQHCHPGPIQAKVAVETGRWSAEARLVGGRAGSWGRSVRACVEAAGARAYVFFFHSARRACWLRGQEEAHVHLWIVRDGRGQERTMAELDEEQLSGPLVYFC